MIRIRVGSEVDRRCCCTLVYCRQSSQFVKAEQAEKQEAEMKLSMKAPQLGCQMFASQLNCFNVQRFQHKTPQTSCSEKYSNLLRINTLATYALLAAEKSDFVRGQQAAQRREKLSADSGRQLLNTPWLEMYESRANAHSCCRSASCFAHAQLRPAVIGARSCSLS